MKYAHPLVLSFFALIPYVLLVWGYTKWTDGDSKEFWLALGVLLGIRFFFFVIEMLGDILSWRLYRRQIMVNNAVAAFKSDGFPFRRYADDSLSNYLARIEDDPQYPDAVRVAAKTLYRNLANIEQQGILVGARSWWVWETALDIYSPRSKAPPFSFSNHEENSN